MDLGGDWNVAESEDDRSTGFTGTTRTKTERTAWSKFMLAHGLRDIHNTDDFTYLTAKHFTWQGKSGGQLTLSRIDRFYRSQSIHAFRGSIGAWPTLAGIFDHSPVLCQINKAIKLPRSRATFHKPLLHSQDGHLKLKSSWTEGLSGAPEATWSHRVTDAIQSTMKCSDTLKRQEKVSKREAHKEQLKDILEAEEKLHRNWGDEQAKQILSAAQ